MMTVRQSCWFVALVVAISMDNNFSAEAFSIFKPPALIPSSRIAATSSNTRLFMSSTQVEEDNNNENSNKSEEEAAPEEEEAVAASAEEEDIQEEEEEEVEEDPELVAIREEIAELETTLKRKVRQARETSDLAEEYTKAGYARKVAEMENMRRARSSLNSSNKFSSTANILAQFLPVLDRLNHLKQVYGDDEFGQKYNALPGTLWSAFKDLGVAEYTASVGDKVDSMKHLVVESVYSTDYDNNVIIEPKSMGLELQGNVVRMAECVASLGPEPVEEEEESEEEESVEENDETKDQVEASTGEGESQSTSEN